MQVQALFHLAFPVHDLEAARRFYAGVLGCAEGRSSPHWIDFNFYGHQIVAHLSHDDGCHGGQGAQDSAATSMVDGEAVPLRHFGAVLSMADWQVLADKLKGAGTRFIIEPGVRFEGAVGEQATMFFLDPSGNALEFKAFADLGQVFAK